MLSPVTAAHFPAPRQPGAARGRYTGGTPPATAGPPASTDSQRGVTMTHDFEYISYDDADRIAILENRAAELERRLLAVAAARTVPRVAQRGHRPTARRRGQRRARRKARRRRQRRCPPTCRADARDVSATDLPGRADATPTAAPTTARRPPGQADGAPGPDQRTEALINHGRPRARRSRPRRILGTGGCSRSARSRCWPGSSRRWSRWAAAAPAGRPAWPPSRPRSSRPAQNPDVAAEPSGLNFACDKDTQPVLWVFSLLTSGNNPSFVDQSTGRKGLEPIQPAQGGDIAWSLNLHHPVQPGQPGRQPAGRGAGDQQHHQRRDPHLDQRRRPGRSRAWRARRPTASATPARRSWSPGRATRPAAPRRSPRRGPGGAGQRRLPAVDGRHPVADRAAGRRAVRERRQPGQPAGPGDPEQPAGVRRLTRARPQPATTARRPATAAEPENTKHAKHRECNRRRGEVVPVRPVRKPWWQQATALVTVSTGGVITGFNFVPGAAATMTSPTSVPLHLLALEQAAQPGALGDLAVGGDSATRATSDAQLRAAIVNVAGVLPAARQDQDAGPDGGADLGQDQHRRRRPRGVLRRVRQPHPRARRAGGRPAELGDRRGTYPWPLHEWADVRVDTNPASPASPRWSADAQAHGRWHPLGDGYQPQPGDWAAYDGTSRSSPATPAACSTPSAPTRCPASRSTRTRPPARSPSRASTGFVDNGNLKRPRRPRHGAGSRRRAGTRRPGRRRRRAAPGGNGQAEGGRRAEGRQAVATR